MADQEDVYVPEADLIDGGDEDEVDDNVLACLPEGTKIVRAVGYGASYWSRTARVDTEQEDGSDKTYFLKVADGSNGHSMMQGEYESMSTMYKYGPDLVPRPIAWGTFAKDPEVHFFISDFREMDSEVPEMEKLCARLAALHQNSHQSGIKQYGFHVITHNGSIPQDVEWTDSWEEFYARGLRHMLVLEEQAQGPQSDEMKIVLGALFDKVIPRLLRPLETDGRSIVPSVVHGDFWHGNCATDVETNDPLLFDASAFWGHNEYDLRTMARRTRFKFGPSGQKDYLKHYPPAAPAEDFDARSALYILRSEVHDSILFPTNPKFRQALVHTAATLVEAFPEGYEGWLEEQKPGFVRDHVKYEETQKRIIDSLR